MPASDPNSDFITKSREDAGAFLEAISRLRERAHSWNALYNAIIVQENFTGENASKTLSQLQALFTTLAAFETLLAAGHETNLEAIK